MRAKNKMVEMEARRRIGRRIRRRRLLSNLTQEALARGLGVSFQQVQKYENGVSPVPPQRLAQISRLLDVGAEYFSGANADLADNFESFVQSREGIAFYRALATIPDARIRARLIMALEAFSDSQTRPEESDVGQLAAWLKRIGSEQESNRHCKSVAHSVHAMKVELAELIGQTLQARKLTQKFAARILATDQARISALARGNVEATSLEKLLRYLVLLGWDAEVAVAKRPTHADGKIEVRKGG